MPTLERAAAGRIVLRQGLVLHLLWLVQRVLNGFDQPEHSELLVISEVYRFMRVAVHQPDEPVHKV
jgi:hypothetical protein